MNVGIKLGVGGFKTQVMLAPELYDGHPPIESIFYHTRMRILDPNVSAVSTAIALQNYASESFNFYESIQAHVADAIETFIGNRRFRVNPVEQTPKALPQGMRRAAIGAIDSNITDATVFELGSSHVLTSSGTLDRVDVSSNVACFLPNNTKGHAISTLAAATFVSPDYAFGEICMSQEMVNALGEDQFRRHRKLLESINIKLSKVNSDD